MAHTYGVPHNIAPTAAASMGQGGHLGNLPPSASLASVSLIGQLAPHSGTMAWATLLPKSLAWSRADKPSSNGNPPNLSQQLVGLAPMQGLSLSPATEPFPQKLVDRVRTGQYIEMRDLLTDNIALLQQLETFNNNCQLPGLPGVLRP